MRDIISNVKVLEALAPQVIAADANAAVDRLGFDSLMFVVDVGASGDTLATDVKFDLYLEHADDNGSGSAGTYAGVTGTYDAQGLAVDEDGKFATIDGEADAGQMYRIGYVGDKRHVRVRVDATGTHENGTPMSVMAVMGNADRLPVSY